MRRAEVRKLLGGHATGTLTEAERKALYAAALEDQALFDALMDEEALRELLADPEARAQVLAALAPAPPKVVPFWRRPGILGAAAGVLMASLAGLTWLRNPQAPPPVQQERSSPKVLSLPEAAEAPGSPAEPLAAKRKPAPRPAQEPAARPAEAAPAPMPAAPRTEQAHRQEKAASPPAPASVPGGMPGGVPGGVIGGAVGGVAGGVVGGAQAPASARDQVQNRAREEARRAPAAAVTAVLAEAPVPVWHIAFQAGDLAEVLVSAPHGAQVVLLRRGRSGVEVQAARASEPEGSRVRWRYLVRLGAADALDLYLPAHAVPDPAALPETGPVDGFRARIFPEAK